ncbi:helix-turn-helix transcriptional regulator [Sphingobium sp. AS12]|uniref:helix-turn-helix transcriptional regulator n=1 Tax=Sphingobium sp. AS12 TaxID=2849495 RepID=UPI001C31496E|nr:helix-turn-helix transcriptional regulator [Sphingobium sp. AS12]MBV2149998.1 helix-turn-helix transcriptional regulator [Sphingobium sp. AS12]
MRERSVTDISNLIGMIYDCALDPECWPEALAAMRRQLGFQYATLALQALPAGIPLLQASSGLAAEWLARIPDYSADFIDRWGGRARVDMLPLTEPAVLSRVNPGWNLHANRYFCEWAEPQGIHDVMALGVLRGPDAIGSIILARHHEQGEISEQEISLGRLLLPHLQRVIAISRILETERLTTSSLRAVLDRLTVGVVLVDTVKTILHANRAAQMMLQSGDVISSRRNCLEFTARAASMALDAAIGRGRPGRGARSCGVDVPIRDERGQNYMVHILPITKGSRRAEVQSAASAALFINPVSSTLNVRRPALATMFELTDAETRVLESITQGSSVGSAARALGVSMATVKTHLQHIFDKTGVRRQADLVALVASLALSPDE